VQFETVPDLISGLELTMSGYKVAWSVTEYLALLERRVSCVEEKSATNPIGNQVGATHVT
jgi:F-type H+-transporting ATPase subunit b